MLISHPKQFIFIKVPKTASSSIEEYLLPYCVDDCSTPRNWNPIISNKGVVGGVDFSSQWQNHASALQIKNQTGDWWDKYFKFCSVRNPFDACVSSYFFSKHVAQKNYKTYQSDPRISFKPSFDNDVQNFGVWLIHSQDVLPTYYYFKIDDHMCMDYFIRYEELKQGLQYVCDRLDILFDVNKIPKIFSGIRRTDIPVSEYYTSELIELMERIFAWELEYFDYKMPKSA